MNFATIVKTIRTFTKDHASEIMVGFGIAGMTTAGVFAVMATPKALEKIEEKKEELGKDELTIKETIVAAGPCYIPAATLAVTSAGCLIASVAVSKRQHAALATAYAISAEKLSTYQEKVTSVIGEKKEEAIRNEIAKDKIRENPPQNREIIVTGNGDTKCYDVLSDRYFYSSIDKIRSAVADLNRQMLDDRYITLNEYYYAIGLKGTKEGDLLGWHIDRGYIDIHFSSVLDESSKTPCISVDCDIEPVACPNY